MNTVAIKTTHTRQVIACCVAGALYPFAFAPYGYYLLSLLCLTLLFYSWQHVSAKRAAIHAGLFAFIIFSTGCGWIFHSIVTFGGGSTFLGLLLTGMLALVMALFYSAQAYLFIRLRYGNHPLQWITLLPVLWAAFSYLRCHVFTGFPWLMVGYSQNNSFLSAYAPLIGIYGVNALCAFIGGCLLITIQGPNRRWRYFAIGCILIIIGLNGQINNRRWTHPEHKPLRASMIQGNIEQSIKWQPQQLRHTLNMYRSITQKHWQSDLIIWPEGAIPTFEREIKKPFLDPLSRLAKKNHSTIMTGLALMQSEQIYFNAIKLYGKNTGTYYKHHLVPFGEYYPMRSISNIVLSSLNIPMSDFTPGDRNQPPLTINQIKFAPFMCYEITYPDLVLDRAQNSNALVVLSDDSWFGDSAASEQQIQMAQWQALETQRPILYTTNNGVTAFINRYGQRQIQLPVNQRSVLTVTFQGVTGNTPLMRWGYTRLWIALLVILFIYYTHTIRYYFGLYDKKHLPNQKSKTEQR